MEEKGQDIQARYGVTAMKEVIGKPLDRVDGRLKVTGGARYPAEISVANIAYGVLVGSTIANGRIRRLNTRAAARVPGVLKIFTRRNTPKLGKVEIYPVGSANMPVSPLRSL
jgi:xanthine dehydrogenase YagR molybdenum-binding subunit